MPVREKLFLHFGCSRVVEVLSLALPIFPAEVQDPAPSAVALALENRAFILPSLACHLYPFSHVARACGRESFFACVRSSRAVRSALAIPQPCTQRKTHAAPAVVRDAAKQGGGSARN